MFYSPAPNQINRWEESELCSCLSDCGTCWTTLFCPCVTYAENGQMLYEGTRSAYCEDCFIYCFLCTFTCCTCLLGISRRKDLRKKYNLGSSPCDECCVHCCCHLCALCQENRELRARLSSALVTRHQPRAIPSIFQVPTKPQSYPLPDLERVDYKVAPWKASAPPLVPKY